MLRPVLAAAWLQLAGAGAFLAWARWRHSATMLHAGLLPLAAAAIATGIAYDAYPAAAWPVLNGACLTGTAAIAMLVTFALQAERCGAATSLRPAWLGTAQLAVTALATLETAACLQRGDAAPTSRTVAAWLGWVWFGLGVAGTSLGASLANARVFILGLLPLLLSCFVPLVTFTGPLAPYALVANARFLFAVATSVAIAALRRPLLRFGQRPNADLVGAVAFALLLLWSGFEVVAWGRTDHSDPEAVAWIVWLLGVTAVLATIGGAWRAHATGNPVLRGLARTVLLASTTFPFAVYLTWFGADWMFANPRFLLVAGAIAALLLWRRLEPQRTFLGPTALGVALLGLTVESPAWFFEHIAESSEAARLAKFAITVTWVASASVLLGVGFRLHRRGLRLTALGLFVLTAVKLLALDMSGAQQLYRILAFVLVGVVFVGASWLYHRVERRLAASRSSPV
jgi:hypothetical protein